MCPRKFDWAHARRKIMETFSERLIKGEHVMIWEDESIRYLGASIKDSMPDKCILEKGHNPDNVTGTVSRHLGQLGFSNRLRTKEGKQYVELWINTTSLPPRTHQKLPTTEVTKNIFETQAIGEFREWVEKMRSSAVIDYVKKELVPEKSGIYTAWMNNRLIYVGSSTKSKSRISSHYNGQRGSDQFCLYIFDRFLLPELCKETDRLSTYQINKRTANWIRQNIKFRWVEVAKTMLDDLEKRLRKEWKPLLNPL